jgi:hypothetical protein
MYICIDLLKNNNNHKNIFSNIYNKIIFKNDNKMKSIIENVHQQYQLMCNIDSATTFVLGGIVPPRNEIGN